MHENDVAITHTIAACGIVGVSWPLCAIPPFWHDFSMVCHAVVPCFGLFGGGGATGMA